MTRMPSKARSAWPLAIAVLLLASLGFLGCGEDDAAAPIQQQEATDSAQNAISIQLLSANEDNLEAIENPLINAAGDWDDLSALGDVNVGPDWTASKHLSSATSTWRRDARLAAGVRAKTAVGEQLWPVNPSKACNTDNLPNGQRVECVDPMEGNVILLTITLTHDSPGEDHIVEIEWTYQIDTKGTAETIDDDMLALSTRVTLADGSTILTTIDPVEAGPIVDNTMVNLVEVISPADGEISSQTNSITMNAGLLDVDGDETIWNISSVIAFANGASSSISVEELETSDGIRDDDVVTLTHEFTAAPTNAELESIVSTIWIDVQVLSDEADDLFGQLERVVTLDGQTVLAGVATIRDSYQPDQWVAKGEEPCSGTFSREGSFPSDWEIQTLSRQVEHDCEQGGNSSLDIGFSDATSFHRDITWNGSGDATLSATHRDGTAVVGSYTAANGSFTITTTFPLGNAVASVVQSGSSVGSTRTYDVVTTFADQTTATLSVVSVEESTGLRTITGSATNAEGTTTFTASYDPATATLTGSAIGPDGGTIEYSIAQREDGTRLFVFTAHDPSTDVTVTGSLVLTGDGSGCGTVTIRRDGQSVTLTACFNVDGTGQLEGEDGVIEL